ncbi:MAG TPA: cadmium resistance transporter, partial [Anaerolineales bacterium]|nr:cadmium resistance transporter [Anaerolineales bacterium]
PEEWMIGLLGLIPLGLGLKVLFSKEEEEGEDEAEEQKEQVMESSHKYGSLVASITFLTIASGGDNIGVYIPLFSSQTWNEIGLILSAYALLTAVLLYISYRFANLKYVGETIEKYERIIVPVVFIGLGIMIMSENGVFSFLASIFGLS